MTIGSISGGGSGDSGRLTERQVCALALRGTTVVVRLRSPERGSGCSCDPDQADKLDEALARFGEVQEEYEHLGGYAIESQAREVLRGLGFDDERIDGDVGALSGGWQMHVEMARILLSKPGVLLLDEPTNHLDIESIV